LRQLLKNSPVDRYVSTLAPTSVFLQSPLRPCAPTVVLSFLNPCLWRKRGCAKNLAANAITNVEVIEAAVADFSGKLSFSDNGPWSVANHGAVTCKSVRLDDLDLGAPAFIKIDVEGFEPNVLAGAHRLIAEARPLIFMEYCALTLLRHHYDPLTFAAAIWSSFDVLQIFYRERSQPLSPDPLAFLHANLIQYECVNDLLLRPKAPIPTMERMIHYRPYSPT
jgi:FkbM family methyltransferase